ncbi:MAG: PepSY domain-containing protein [Gammaproteobacteria bacterium]
MAVVRVFIVLLGLAAVPAGAADLPAPRAWLVQAMPDIGVDRATSIARGATGGRVLAVRRVDAGGRMVYEVKVLTDGGMVRTVMVDAASGAVW